MRTVGGIGLSISIRSVSQSVSESQSSELEMLAHLKSPLVAAANMSSLPTGCCAVQWAMWKGGGLTSRDRLNSSENYLLLGFLLATPSQTVLLLVRQSVN